MIPHTVCVSTTFTAQLQSSATFSFFFLPPLPSVLVLVLVVHALEVEKGGGTGMSHSTKGCVVAAVRAGPCAERRKCGIAIPIVLRAGT
jgi:hypothetical protein